MIVPHLLLLLLAQEPAPPSTATPVEAEADARFLAADTNHDGKISLEEWQGAGKRDPKGVFFHRVDTDGDGFVSKAEAAAARDRVTKYFAGKTDLDPSGMTITSDVPYATIEGVDPKLLSLDVYAPETNKLSLKASKHPVVVMIHGGGWSLGDKGNGAAAATKSRFFVDHGYVFVSINYRLSPAVTHPAHVDDCAAAIAWTHDHIAEYGGDPDAIFVMGHSAGAHLAALVAVDETRLKSHRLPLTTIKGVILLDSAAYDLARTMPSLPASGSIHEMYFEAFGADEKAWKDASPSAHVAKDKGIPPFLVFYTGRALAKERSDEFVAALVTAGVSATDSLAKGQDHAAINREFGTEGDAVTARSLEFLEGLRHKQD